MQIQTGMIDKGADLTWVSQYPHEAELCFPPLASMQVLGTSVEGSVLVVSLRLNLNLTSPTIEEAIGKRRKVAADMCHNLCDEVRGSLAGWRCACSAEAQFERIRASAGTAVGHPWACQGPPKRDGQVR